MTAQAEPVEPAVRLHLLVVRLRPLNLGPGVDWESLGGFVEPTDDAIRAEVSRVALQALPPGSTIEVTLL